ncbi:MAG: hypothetical protein MJK12_12550 [Colwellia sp.]|nr:hypothetical protein [Colwellia sp.]
MKHILTLLMLLVSNYAFANSTLPDSSLFVTLNEKDLIKYQVFSRPSLAISYANNAFEYQNTSAPLWQSADAKFHLNEITIRKFTWQTTELQTTNDADDYYLLKGVTVNYHSDKLVLSLGMLNNESLIAPQEKIFIQGSLTVLAVKDFNVSLQGRIETQNLPITIDNSLSNMLSQQNEISIKKSLSITGSYILNDSWAVTGTMVTSDINKGFKKLGDNEKSSDNMALIGTTYSF